MDRRRPGKAVFFLMVLMCTSIANAQSFYVRSGPYPATYVPLSGGTLTNTSVAGAEQVSIPFDFNFFGVPYPNVSISLFGYLTFLGTGTSSSNKGIPHSDGSSSSPQVFIAPWWDNIRTTAGTQILWQVVGSPPQRRLVVEWRDVVMSGSTSKFSFQAQLFEQTHQVRFVYGGNTPVNAVSASIGIQGGISKGTAGMPCTNAFSGACSAALFPLNQAIDFKVPPDLQPVQLSSDPVAYNGVPFRMTLAVKNIGGTEATVVTNQIYLSSDTTFDANDFLLLETTPISIMEQETQKISFTGTIPNGKPIGTYYLIAKTDEFDMIDEIEEANNQLGPIVLQVGAPRPDLSAGSISTESQVPPGGTLNVTRQILNRGNATISTAFSYTYMLSENEAISRSDLPLGTSQTVSQLMAGATNTRTDSVAVPSDLRSGEYWLGLCVDYNSQTLPKEQIQEISELNNCSSDGAKVRIVGDTLTVTTTALPIATQYSPYGAQLTASGGGEPYTWSQTAGMLPKGLQLTAQGAIRGTPATTGTYSIGILVTSGSQMADVVLSIQVQNGSLPLTVPDQSIPTAVIGKPYSTRLFALGGTPPYKWTLTKDSVLPTGLAVSRDGVLEGVAQELGEQSLSVQVSDSKSGTQTLSLTLRTVASSQMQISTRHLSHAVLDKDYLQTLDARAGLAPYQWSVLKFQNLTEQSEPIEILPPEFGLQLTQDLKGNTILEGKPAKVGQFLFTMQVADAEGAKDSQSYILNVFPEEALAITTLNLPDAFVNTPYQTRVVTNVAAENVSNLTFTQTSGSLPSGLKLSPTGTISGFPTKVSGDSLPKVYTVLLQVTDPKGRSDVRAMTIRMRDEETQGSCGAIPGLEMVSLIALLPLVLRRRGR